MSQLTKTITATIAAASISVLLAACGGGSGSGSTENASVQNTNTGGRTDTDTGKNPGSNTPVSSSQLNETARFSSPENVFLDSAGNLYVHDTGNLAIRRIATNGQVSTVQAYNQWTMAADKDGNLYTFDVVLDSNGYPDRYEIYQTSPDGTKKFIYSFVMTPGSTIPMAMRADVAGKLHVVARYRQGFYVLEIDIANPPTATLFGYGGFAEQNPESGRLLYTTTIFGYDFEFALDSQANLAFFGDHYLGNGNEALTITPRSAQPAEDTSPAGGNKLDIPVNTSAKLAYDPSGNLYILDYKSSSFYSDAAQQLAYARSEMRLRKIATNGTVTTLLQNFPDGRASDEYMEGSTKFGLAAGIDAVYLSDPLKHAIYKVSSSGQVTLIAGHPGEAGSSD